MKCLTRIVLMLILGLSLQSCYLLKNAYYLNSLYHSRRNVEEVLKDDKTSENIKSKLRTANDILVYAKDAGLRTEDKYTDYIDVGDRPISYLVEAAEVDELKRVTWWFPIVGDVPYLGYLEKKERDEKAQSLRNEGYDVSEGEASAFSGLGWFRDPILSSYLKGSDASLANLLFHELTHATVWIPGSVEFNENLASYVGDVLTIEYLQSRKQTEVLNRYLIKKSDRERFGLWLQELYSALDALYKQRGTKTKAEILFRKKEIFDQFLAEKRPKFSLVDYLGKEPWNNAVVLAAALYISKADQFAKARACLGDIGVGLFLRKIKETSKSIKDPFQALESFCIKTGVEHGS